MEGKNTFGFPILSIKKIGTLLSKNEMVFAYEIVAKTQSGKLLTIYENKGLNLNSYLGETMECLLEITKGEFYKREDESLPKNVITFRYEWRKRIYEFFPEMVEMRDKLEEEDEDDAETLQELFETKASKLLKDWGLNGLGIGVFQDKPLLSSPDGFFLLNEYQFEEEVDKLELGQEVYIRIDEAFLRGIRPCEIPKESNQKKGFTAPKQSPVPVPPEQKDESKELIQQKEPNEQKKRKFFFD